MSRIMKTIVQGIVLALCIFLASGSALAQSAKSAVQVSSLTLVPWTTTSASWTTIIGNSNPFAANAVTIKTSSQKDLIFSAALECGLYTKTLVRSKGGTSDTSLALAGVKVRLLLDPGTAFQRIAEPGDVTFCRRSQELSATLQGIIGNLSCFVDGVFTPGATGCLLTEETISLVLDTLNANAFIFALDDVGTGLHNVIVQSQIDIDKSVQLGEADAKALIGKGALEVEEVRLVKGVTIAF